MIHWTIIGSNLHINVMKRFEWQTSWCRACCWHTHTDIMNATIFNPQCESPPDQTSWRCTIYRVTDNKKFSYAIKLFDVWMFEFVIELFYYWKCKIITAQDKGAYDDIARYTLHIMHFASCFSLGQIRNFHLTKL